MIVEDLLVKSHEFFEKSNFNWIYLINSYLLSISYAKIKGMKVNSKTRDMLQSISEFYWYSLKKAVDETERIEDESDTSYKLRVKQNYHIFRKDSFLSIQEFIPETYRYIFLFTQIRPEDVGTVRTNLITKKTLYVLESDYEI